MTKKILCRADGNSEIGLGHVYRMLAIAAFYKETYELIFITKESTTSSIIPKEFTVNFIPESVSILEEPQWISNKFSFSNHIIIADGYQFVSSYQKEIKKQGFTLIYIDDLVQEHQYADVVINHSPYTKIDHYKSETYTQFALGTSYAMLRPLFNEAAKQTRIITKINTAFICFGGADPFDLSLRAASALLRIKAIKNTHVVLGGAYKHKGILALAKNNSNLQLHQNLNEEGLCKLMQSCHIAIAPSSTILYEICAVKMPVLSGYYVENQKNIFKGLHEKDVVVKGDDFTNYNVADFEKAIIKILESKKINHYIENQHKLFTGDSKTNFLGLLNRLNVSFRKANETDVMMVYNWSNNVLVRNNSYNSAPIVLSNHKKWFESKIKDYNTLFLIALVNNKPAGIVRYSIEDEFAVVGILVSETYRGQKLAATFLKKAADLYFKTQEKPILAYIKKENSASIKAFEAASYRYFKDDMIQENISFVYKLKKEDVTG